MIVMCAKCGMEPKKWFTAEDPVTGTVRVKASCHGEVCDIPIEKDAWITISMMEKDTGEQAVIRVFKDVTSPKKCDARNT